MLNFIPKPQTNKWRIINIILGMVLIVVAVFYIFASIDLVPDAAGAIGYLDDLIVFILALFFVNRFWKRITYRWNRNKEAYKELWRKGDLTKIMLSGRFWFAIIIIGLVVTYFIWTIDLIPDAITGLGYADDAVLAIGALIALMRFYWTETRK